jgi:hypothetical protein
MAIVNQYFFRVGPNADDPTAGRNSSDTAPASENFKTAGTNEWGG